MNKNTPIAYITIGRNRKKIYKDNLVYLNNGDEFEIEFFNPTQDVYLATISINGKSISNSGLILNPGKREFLERYFDEPKKFKFSTYMVEDNNSEVDKAIENNGLIEISFYKEKINKSVEINEPKITYFGGTWEYSPNYNLTDKPINVYYSDTTAGNIKLDNITTSNVNLKDNNSLVSNTIAGNTLENSFGLMNMDLEKETGRIDKGNKSNDEFIYVNKDFETYPISTITYKILPESQKPKTTKDIKVYCTTCGTKRRKDTWKFCPNCGTKY